MSFHRSMLAHGGLSGEPASERIKLGQDRAKAGGKHIGGHRR